MKFSRYYFYMNHDKTSGLLQVPPRSNDNIVLIYFRLSDSNLHIIVTFNELIFITVNKFISGLINYCK